MTITLLTDSQGKKMGKTAGNAVWLDANKTTPYEFYQYWRNVDAADVIKCLLMLTFIPVETIKEYEKFEGSELNTAKEILAYELTKMIHGEEEAQKAQATARSLFGGNSAIENMPTTTLSEDDFTEGKISLLDMMLKSQLIPSKGEGRRLIQQGGVSVNDKKISEPNTSFEVSQFGEGILVKKGKKVYHRFIME